MGEARRMEVKEQFVRVYCDMHLLTLKTVLVAMDRDEASLAALDGGAALSAAAGAALHVVHVTDDPGFMPDSLPGSGTRDAHTRVHIVQGDPATSIRAVGDQVRADVIVLGPHRRQTVTAETPTLGCTALGVVTNASAPCLIVVDSFRLPLHHILVPVDLSDTSRGALHVALSWASALRPVGKRGTAKLTALYVGPTSASIEPNANRVQALEREAEEIRATAGGWASVEVHTAAAMGKDVAAAIARYAAENDVALVVLATRGLGLDPVGRLGSVADDSLRLLQLPILLVPPAVWLSYARS